MKKILITGANGFIGRHALPFLMQEGYEIYATHFNKSEVINSSTITWINVDLLDQNQIPKIFETVKPDCLLHFAWYVDPKTYLDSSLNLNWARSSLCLYQAFIENGGKRAVFAGTSAEYDWNNEVLSEASPCAPATIYGACKYSLFKILEKFAEKNHLSFAWGRIFNLYGPNESSFRFVPYLINSFLKQQKVICKNPNFERDYLFVEDVGRAFVKLLDSDFMGAVNIGSGNSYLLKNIVIKIAKILDRETLVELSESQDKSKLIADASILKNIIKFKPEHDLDSGLIRTVDWWKKNIY